MAVSLDPIDVRLLVELQTDADRPNVELARLVGLSPAATLNRVRRLKESGVLRAHHRRGSTARPPASRCRSTCWSRWRATTRPRTAASSEAVLAMPQVIAADWVTGEVDAMLMVVARDVAELQRVLQPAVHARRHAPGDAAAARGAQAVLAAAARADA